MTIKSRLDRLETRHAGTTQIYVTRDGGETYQSKGQTCTRAQMDAMKDAHGEPVIFRVVRDDDDQAVRL